MTNVRAYLPMTFSAFSHWPSVTPIHAFAVDLTRTELGGEALEEAEWVAMNCAAQSLNDPDIRRVVLAADVPAPATYTPVGDAVVTFTPEGFDPNLVVSAHLADSAEDDLMWYDASEFGELLKLPGQ